ncbi:MAG TPA: DNA polymerase III subunit chi [Alphaproteobacteria bacterium]|nr:DNA polymerase III subunit chi [Alphaproteobacteria bacterium]
MTEVWFYHLQRRALEEVLPQLLEKVLVAKKRAVVLLSSEERVEAINNLLWTYDDGNFLPHGSARDGFAAEQPIWLTANDENPNSAEILVLADGAHSAQISRYERCLELFDGNDAASVAAARSRWKDYKDAGHDVAYWQQDTRGKWEKKA